MARRTTFHNGFVRSRALNTRVAISGEAAVRRGLKSAEYFADL